MDEKATGNTSSSPLSAVDAERLRRGNDALATGLDQLSRIQGGIDRFTWILWAGLVAFVCSVGGCMFLRSGTGG